MNSKSSNKSFGLLFFIVFLIIGFWPLLNDNSPNILFLILAIFFLILGLINSKILTPFNKMWIKLGELLGVIISPIVLGLIYFFVIFPTSLLLKLFNKDILNLNFKSIDKSQWKKRKENIGTMDKQF